jgi:sulfite exporter TauE/SafE
MHHHVDGVHSGGLAIWGFDLAQFSPLVALLVFGVFVGVSHCTGMCGPFVIARAIGAAAQKAVPGNVWQRLMLGALPAYHAGRATTYMAIGAISGLIGATLVDALQTQRVRLGLVLLALALVLLQPLSKGMLRMPVRWFRPIAMLATRLSAMPRTPGTYCAGIVYGLLPCGMVYAAAVVAAATADPIAGAAAMGAFAFGTWLPLIGVGVAGLTFARQWRQGLQRWSPFMLALNLAALGVWLAHAA